MPTLGKGMVHIKLPDGECIDMEVSDFRFGEPLRRDLHDELDPDFAAQVDALCAAYRHKIVFYCGSTMGKTESVFEGLCAAFRDHPFEGFALVPHDMGPALEEIARNAELKELCKLLNNPGYIRIAENKSTRQQPFWTKNWRRK